MAKDKAVVMWSGGKDSALALYEAGQAFDVAALLTTVTEGYDRISMHGVRTLLLERQADSLRYPLEKVVIPQTCSNEIYETKMREALERYRDSRVSCVICGDLFLEDVRRYREESLFPRGMQGVFPLWQKNTTELALRFIALGFRAVLCCIDTNVLPGEYAGRLFGHELLAELPPEVDPCGENGEFHTFVFDGPSFTRPVEYKPGERVLREHRFCYCDLLPPAG